MIYYLDFCSLSLPHDHFYSGLLPDDLDGKDIQKLQDREIDEIVFKLKQNELNRNFVRSGKKTSLHYAAYWGSQTCVQTLILQGSDLTARDEYGLTPIIWACRSDRLGNLVILLKAAKIRSIPEKQWMYDSSGYHLIHHTLLKDDRLKCLEYLSNSEYGLNVDSEGQNALHHAAMKGFSNGCKIILQYKPNAILLNQFNSENRTPLHLATINGHGNIVNLLLSHKANPYLHDKNNCSAYQYANMKRLYFCLLIYERYNVGKEKQQDEKHSLNENLINELTSFRPVNPQFSHYQGQLTEIKSMISSRDIQNNKVKNNFKIKRELLPTDKRVHRNGNSTVPSKRISQQIDKLQNPTLKIRNSIQSSSSDHSDVDSKRNDEHNEALKSRPYNNHGVSNNSNVMNATYNKGKINSKDVDKLKNADSSSVSDINSIPDTERNPMPTPRKTPYTSEINQSSWKSVLYHSRLLKRDQVNNMPQQNSMNNNHKISMNKSNSIHLEYEDEIIPLNMKLFTKSTVNSSYLNKTLLCNNNNNNNLLSPSLNSVHRKIINVNKK
ncbi:unnamed protein product [Schistosoma rodhaini]|uniref:Uncharacterized protein n=1 Tax=Schistosoma rodhaini TaxID=6188 RepID=A0AA85FRF2_9TREM|nr:unnamed protein product [Schistosoma rodhaini]